MVDDRVPGGYQVLAWQTVDSGVSWQMLPAARPFELVGEYHPACGRCPMGASCSPRTRTPSTPEPVALVSTAGPLIHWDSCVPAAGADCRFVTLTDVDVAWHGPVGHRPCGLDRAGRRLDPVSHSRGPGWFGRSSIRRSPDADLTDADASSAPLRRRPGRRDAPRDGRCRACPCPFALVTGGARLAHLRGATCPGARRSSRRLSTSPVSTCADVSFSTGWHRDWQPRGTSTSRAPGWMAPRSGAST